MSRPVATTVVRVDFGRQARPRPTVAATGRVPRVARLLALAHRVEQMIRDGELTDLAHAARLAGVTRARMTQIVNLTLLAPAIQEDILAMPPITKGRDTVTERMLRGLVAEPVWGRQIEIWNGLMGRTAA